MKLRQAFRVEPNTRLAFVGAGGKTTGMFRLAREVAPAIVTATTHLATDQLAQADRHFVVTSPEEVRAATWEEGVCLFTGPVEEEGRTRGVDGATLEELRALAEAHSCPFLIEADGSRQLPLKAPAEHEPAIPAFVDTVVVVAGLSGLGQALSAECVHRPERFAALSGLGLGERVTKERLVRVLTHPLGGLKNIPAGARRVVLLNQADSVERQSLARGMVEGLLEGFDGVGISVLEASDPVFAMHEKMAGVVLAAGASRRMRASAGEGVLKQLLDWEGMPLVRHMTEVALAGGLSPVVVVTGAEREAVAEAIRGLPVIVKHNPAWAEGQSSSVKVGLGALPAQAGGAVFLLVDQPFVSGTLIRALREEHTRTLAPIVAPLIDEQRGNPVLFDRVTFGDFAGLQGDVGARPLFARYRPVWVPWHDGQAMLDVDTWEDYARLRGGV
ncbi:MAG: putative selenium-dependent hydroxylase accessory protein YqeC [Anaerolineales bacterium]|nr:putative selenium-dependent hydroxylase accessory protein YqeC [Anaerolineales bacterium]